MSQNKMFATWGRNPLSIYFTGSCSELLQLLSDIATDNFPEEDHSDEIDYPEDGDEFNDNNY